MYAQPISARSRLALTCLLLSQAFGCVSPTRNEPVPPEPVGVAKAGSKDGAPTQPTPDVSVPTTNDQLAFIRRQGHGDAPFAVDDRQFVARLPASPSPGSVEEAALSVGVIQSVLHPLGGPVDTFQEADIGATSKVNASAKAPSLEQVSRDHGLNLPDALSSNPLLGSAGIAKMVVAALSRGTNSGQFKDAIGKALKKQAGQWSDVDKDIPPSEEGPVGPTALQGPPVPANGPSDGATSAAVAGAAAAGGVAAGVAGSPATGTDAGTAVGGAAPAAAVPVLIPAAENSDTALTQAQELADRGDFPAAIAKAKTVPDGASNYAQAQEKIKDYSNLAVQDLRRKAAAAFQTAMPVTDAKTRAEYLKQAKGYLEEAIKSYPDASQLPTVRENLRVISRDLDKTQG